MGRVLNNFACCATDCSIPRAVLSIMENENLDWVVDASGSVLSDGVSPAVNLIYEFVSPANAVLYKLGINASDDASLAGSWSYISGAKTKAEFDTDMLPAISGDGEVFVIDAQTQTDYNNGDRLVIVLTVREPSIPARSCPDVYVIDSVTV